MNQKLLVPAIVLCVATPAISHANDYSRDKDEQLRRDAKRLQEYEERQKEAAEDRYNQKNKKEAEWTPGAVLAALFIVGTILFISIGAMRS